MWEDEILPAFMKSHPNIDVKFAATNTNEYNAAIQSQVDGGTGPDLITCRPYDVNRSWIKKGYFEKLDGKPMLDSFEPLALDPWSDDAGSRYCLPTAAVLAGFYYNKDIFAELGLQVPTTQDEFLAVLKKIKDNGKYTPLAVGSSESWQLAYNGFYSIGPVYWKGEEGRQGLIKGTKKITDPDFQKAFDAFAAWKPYLPKGFESLKYPDMTQLFTLGKAAILPDGSWNINQVAVDGLNVGVFGPPAAVAGGERYLQEMPDMAIGVSAASKNKAAAEEFLAWTATPEFLELYVNKLPGFFSMAKQPVTYTNAAGPELRRPEERREADPAPGPRPAERRHPAVRRRGVASAPAHAQRGPHDAEGDRGTPEGPGQLVQAAAVRTVPGPLPRGPAPFCDSKGTS